MGEHVGRLSDALDNEDVGVIGARARLAQVMKPSGKVFRGGTSRVGNGDLCSVEGHGNMLVLSNGRHWCPDQSHDVEKVRR